MKTTDRDDKIAKIRFIYEAQDAAALAVAHLRHSATFYEHAGEINKAANIRGLISKIVKVSA